MRAWLCLVVLVGCYQPSVQTGLPCSEDGSCPGDQICDQSQVPPTCVEMAGDAAVADADGPDGSPVPCSAGCPSEAPYCDQMTQTCRGCVADSECPSDVCHELNGECVSEGRALYVVPGANGSCSRNSPCGKISDAYNQRTAQRYTIKLADGLYGERIELKVDNGLTMVVISGPDRSWDGPQITATLSSNRVDQNMTVVIEGVSFINTPGDGIESLGSVTLSHVLIRGSGDTGATGRGPLTRILDSRIDQSSATGVVIMNGVGEIERTMIMTNANGGVRFESGTAYSIINTIIGANGTANQGNPGVRIQGTSPPGGSAVFRFNTVARNVTQISNANGFDCGRPVRIESSIMANPPNPLQNEMTGNCTAQTSLFEATAPPGNISANPMFVSSTDFHVLPGSPAVNAAPVAGAPLVDIDGEPRDGMDPPDIGADEVP